MASTFYGLSATNSQGTPVAYYVKLYWEGTAVAPPTTATGGQPAVTTPVPGTTAPSMTITVPVGGLFNLSFDPVNNGGRLWYWVTTNPGPTDATAIAQAIGDQISFIVG
jgi:hypothetical protein